MAIAKRTIGGLTVMSSPLPPMTALELAPEAAVIMAPVLGAMGSLKASDDVAVLGPTVMAVSRELLGGGLMRLAPKLLATTSVIDAAGGEKIDLCDDGAINRAFSGDKMGALLGAIIFAAEVTFGRFFAGFARPASSTPTTPSAAS